MNVNKILKDKLNEIANENDKLIVIKGFKSDLINEDQRKVNIDTIISNKMEYFLTQIYNKKKVISYDEYLALYPIINMQYEKIIILENNLYVNLYPMDVDIDKDILNKLLINFDDEKEGEEYEIGSIEEYVQIYSNVKNIDGEFYVTYNENLDSEKEEYIELFNQSISDEVVINYIDGNQEGIDLNDEEDYVRLVKSISLGLKKEINVINKKNYITNIFIKEKLQILNYLFGQTTKISVVSKRENYSNKSVRKEFKDILSQYWGHKDFRNIKVYDMASLDNKEKKVIEISQGEVIESIVSETEKCINNKEYRDVFVTAPTGAGKSVMFQIPAIYLAEKYDNLLTIVISPLIGLMKDQVNNLELINYKFARTINSDITPIQKQEIINDIADKKCNILYISPETLLSRSDVDQLIGDRKLGLVVIDEAHIVTTWGKQFRPDYWYLGDHLNKIKKNQMKKENKGMGFVIATFTATSIYGGIENMYEETLESLKMIDPVTYLGYIKRYDLEIEILNQKAITNKTEYELNKFDDLINQIEYALAMDKKMLIYFPTVALINRFYEYCDVKGYKSKVSKYHGQLAGYEKEENYEKFLNKDTNIMLATKAFGMGIDIDDIEIVAHFAPTGNVCDYVQEIGRAARRSDLQGEAYYRFMSNDFKHINKLHGLSILKEYQLIEVIKKVYELHLSNVASQKKGNKITKKRNEMLVDAESFSHIFENPFMNEDDGINKVKTAMLLIQKDFERKFSFSPFHVRPIPMFETGFFKISPVIQREIVKEYGEILSVIDEKMNICSLNLKKIWEHRFNYKYSFPQFKYLIYTKSSDLQFKFINDIYSALIVDLEFEKNFYNIYERYMEGIRNFINQAVRKEEYYSVDDISKELQNSLKVNKYKAKSITETLISSMSVYIRDISKSTQAKAFTVKPLKNGDVKYKFLNGTSGFFRWIEKIFKIVSENSVDNKMYLVNEGNQSSFKEIIMGLGILETLDILVFKVLGGKNSQIYIYVNQTKTLKEIIDQPWRYHNKLLEMVSERHLVSVEMLTYIYEGKFTSDEIWNLIEDYFLGIIPEKVIKSYEKKTGKKLKI
ncbi:DEAD/DEAH box helicase [Clostridium sp. SM-530-WT-3G]|uniref:DEAD/DEAH box helicase n=1 Tax=Clostridium sp. SM-530-WT-3G TaxID=2725303 RepID=UPI00145D0991|nr:DEAD/DEAH box helicase [Clostridium sp. SM-530-WT-3G]NME83766.1 ATP-dependent DNA helicase RecQ [Clostridium sp. SM-530-WT-3G]